MKEQPEEKSPTHPPTYTYRTLFKLNAWRAMLQLRRDKVTVGLWGLVSALIGTLFGILYWQQAGDNWRNLMGLLFAIVVAVVFSACLGVSLSHPPTHPPIQHLLPQNALCFYPPTHPPPPPKKHR